MAELPHTPFLDELKLLIRSKYGIIWINSAEEERIAGLMRLLADQMNLPFFTWTRTKGLLRTGERNGIYGSNEVDQALSHIRSSNVPAIYLFHGTGPYTSEALFTERLKEVSQTTSNHQGVVILVGADLELDPRLNSLLAKVTPPEPTTREYWNLLTTVWRDVKAHTPIRVDITKKEIRKLVRNLQGLTLLEAEKVLTKAMVVDQALTAKDIERVIEAKKDIIERDGLLEYYPLESTMSDIAALDGLKTWLRKRKRIIEDPERAKQHGLTFPKGVLLVGIPGTGKSLCAKAVAMEWTLPLLKMDPSTLYNKYIGETERNFRKAMETANRMSPVVLWIDEIEKAFTAGDGDGDGGVTTRVLGTFLSWLQDRTGDVFVVATANDVSKLPPELLRKGRFDELFFVDLPDHSSRKKLFEIHLLKRKQPIEQFSLDSLAEQTNGFTGADIEQVIVSGLYTSFDLGLALDNAQLIQEIKMTRPLSQTMPERIESLQRWAKGRTVPAN